MSRKQLKLFIFLSLCSDARGLKKRQIHFIYYPMLIVLLAVILIVHYISVLQSFSYDVYRRGKLQLATLQ